MCACVRACARARARAAFMQCARVCECEKERWSEGAGTIQRDRIILILQKRMKTGVGRLKEKRVRGGGWGRKGGGV